MNTDFFNRDQDTWWTDYTNTQPYTLPSCPVTAQDVAEPTLDVPL